MAVYEPLVRSQFRERVRTRRAELGSLWPEALAEGYEAHLRGLLVGAEIGTRVRVEVLDSILREGRFKTRHEPGVHSKNPDRHPDEEAEVWNVDARRAWELPIFGYAATIDDVAVPETRRTLHNAYGAARLLLAESVRVRCSVFFGDTLRWLRDGSGAPAPLCAPDELSWPPDLGVPTGRTSIDVCGPEDVVEIQILGGVEAREIKRVILDAEPADALARALSTAGLTLEVNPLPTASVRSC
jgi:hypothetical protein